MMRFLLFLLPVFSFPAWATSQEDDISVVWARQDGRDVNLYHARKSGGRWSRIVALTNGGVHGSPSLFAAEDESVVVWVERQPGGRHLLRYARVSEHGPVRSGILPAPTDAVFSPVVLSA